MQVTFYEEDHKYLNDNGDAYTSATTLIGKYKEPFDADYWSTYKAVEALLTDLFGEEYWKNWKQSVGYKEVNNRYTDVLIGGDLEQLPHYKKQILEKWDYEKNIACFNGTNFHLAQEKGWLSKDEHEVGVVNKSNYKTGIQNVGGINITPNRLKDGVYSELVLWNHYYEIAGQADIVYIETIDGVRYIDIDDYKTNKKIDTESYLNHRTRRYKTMEKPLNKVMDCNFCHYELQISLYAFLLEKFGFTVRNLNFQHWNNIGTKEEPKYEFAQDYSLQYKKNEIEKVLKHFNDNK